MVLIIKQHPFEKYDLRVANLYSNIVVLNNDMLSNRNININQLLGYADALISDYSSAAIDYMLLDRPIAFAIPDLDVYKSSRKLHFDNLDEWLPGIQITTESQFCDFIKSGKCFLCLFCRRCDIIHTSGCIRCRGSHTSKTVCCLSLIHI